MINLTEHLLPHAGEMDYWFRYGVKCELDRQGPLPKGEFRTKWRKHRATFGFADLDVPLLTPPSANLKLAKGVVPSYGLTLQHVTTHVRKGLTVNACPWAGDCIKVCVLDNGNGRFDEIQRARKAKTTFLVEYPTMFAFLLGWELAKAQRKHGHILFRPNVNSDIEWEKILPSLTNGSALNNGWGMATVSSYGYSKNPEILVTDGWVDSAYRVAYSWNENSDPAAVATFLAAGGSVAMVSDRKKGGPLLNLPNVVDADLTDEWIFQHGVIGDLSAKGRARSLIGKSGFVVTTTGGVT